MDWSNVKTLIGTTAPILGTMIGGPTGTAVGTIVSGLLGVNNDPTTIAEELKNNPEALLKLKEYEYTHKEKLEAMQLDELKVYTADVQDARQRQVETQKATGEIDWNFYMLAWLVVGGFFGLIGSMIFVALPEGQNEIIYMLFGTLSAGFGSVMQYFFGTSKGSSDKTKHLVNMKAGYESKIK